MPTQIKLSETPFKYSKEKNTFFISEKHVPYGTCFKHVPFDTEYVLIHPKSNKSLIFIFTHNDGGEFEPDTHWHYESETGIRLEVCNDPVITRKRGDHYLNHKLNQ